MRSTIPSPAPPKNCNGWRYKGAGLTDVADCGRNAPLSQSQCSLTEYSTKVMAVTSIFSAAWGSHKSPASFVSDVQADGTCEQSWPTDVISTDERRRGVDDVSTSSIYRLVTNVFKPTLQAYIAV
jgi:hypothetical protein